MSKTPWVLSCDRHILLDLCLSQVTRQVTANPGPSSRTEAVLMHGPTLQQNISCLLCQRCFEAITHTACLTHRVTGLNYLVMTFSKNWPCQYEDLIDFG